MADAAAAEKATAAEKMATSSQQWGTAAFQLRRFSA